MKIMVLAGGNDQIVLIQYIRKRYTQSEIILVDYLEHPVAKKYADRHIQISTLDRELVLQVARAEAIERIFTACTDQALVTMAYVAEEMGLPTYISYKQALDITNKHNMKRIMVEKGIPTSKYIEVKESKEFDSMSLSFPIVIKPTDSNSSKGICKVENRNELLEAYEKALAVSRTGEVILEEYFDGKEYSVDIWVYHGKAHVILVTETIKNRNKQDGFQIVESYYDGSIQEQLKKRILPCAQTLCEAFEITEGPMIVQLLINKEEISVIELSARTGGGSKIQLIKSLAGFDVMDNLLECYEGIYQEKEVKMYNGYAMMCYVYMQKGIFTSVEGIKELYPNVWREYFMYKENGTLIEKAENSSDRVMGYLIMDSSLEELSRKSDITETTLKICDESGQNKWIRGIYHIK